MKPLFERRGEVFVPTEHCASPWGPVTIHGGASSGLLAWALEAQIPAGMQLARLTVDLYRPVPREPLGVAARVVRESRRLRLLEAMLYHDGREIGRASALALATAAVAIPEHARLAAQPPAPLREALERPPVIGVNAIANRVGREFSAGLHTLVPLKPVSLELGGGRGSTWVQLPVELIGGIPNSPLVRVATLADFSNGFAQLYLDAGTGFINADITLNLHRMPEGEWIGIDARTRAQPHGVAMAESELYDVRGLIGRVSQSNLTMATFSGKD
jgi:acyl-coenzyme A thioesterase PaaI-like protein